MEFRVVDELVEEDLAAKVPARIVDLFQVLGLRVSENVWVEGTVAFEYGWWRTLINSLSNSTSCRGRACGVARSVNQKHLGLALQNTASGQTHDVPRVFGGVYHGLHLRELECEPRDVHS